MFKSICPKCESIYLLEDRNYYPERYCMHLTQMPVTFNGTDEDMERPVPYERILCRVVKC